LRNAGDEEFLNLVTERVLLDDNPATRDQGSDKPGRSFKRKNTNRRSSMENTDWHELEEHRFARQVAVALERLVRDRNVKTLVVAAPPRTLAELRHAVHADIKGRIVGEIDKDLTKLPVAEIERHLS
jgi:protein required for attachment to host cells